jgi:hypothetical protein
VETHHVGEVARVLKKKLSYCLGEATCSVKKGHDDVVLHVRRKQHAGPHSLRCVIMWAARGKGGGDNLREVENMWRRTMWGRWRVF